MKSYCDELNPNLKTNSHVYIVFTFKLGYPGRYTPIHGLDRFVPPDRTEF